MSEKKHCSGSAGYSAGNGIDHPGARLQMLESETQLSRGRLIKLYKELRGSPPPKGMLPFSTDWFMTGNKMFMLRCSVMHGSFTENWLV